MNRDGGPAYPHNFGYGMTMRQFYKAAALQGLLANSRLLGPKEELVYEASRCADLMLAEDEAHERESK